MNSKESRRCFSPECSSSPSYFQRSHSLGRKSLGKFRRDSSPSCENAQQQAQGTLSSEENANGD
jgi:hypothetical protein